MDEEVISFEELMSKITREEGMNDLEFKAIEGLKIQNGKISAGEYLKRLISSGEVTHKNNIYRYCGIRIGVLVDKTGDVPGGFIDRKAHEEFVKNVFITSPYSLE